MPFEHDMIGRTEALKDLMNAVDAVYQTQRGITLGLDGAWGCGKTYLLGALERSLKEVRNDGDDSPRYLVLRYNCWEYDYYDEPLAAIVSVIRQGINEQIEQFSEETYDAANEVLGKALYLISGVMIELVKAKLKLPENFNEHLNSLKETGTDLKALVELFKNKTEFTDSLAPFTKAIEDVREALNALKERYTIVLIVDELDRCLPSYAMKVLERLHHLFNDREKYAVILAMDKKHLHQVVKSCYGSIHNVEHYMKKFIECTYHLRQTRNNRGLFLEKYRSYFNLFDLTEEQKDTCRAYLVELFSDMDMRSQEQIFTQTELLHRMLFPELTGASYCQLLAELVLSVFSDYERTHPVECKWDRLKRYPFSVDGDGNLKLLYQQMHSFEVHIQGTWGMPVQVGSGWMLQRDQEVADAIIGCCRFLNEGSEGSGIWHTPQLPQELVTNMKRYARHLRKFW